MKRKLSLIALLALVLAFAASQAIAGSVLYPQSMNGSSWWFSGFQVSKSSDTAAIFNGDLVTGSDYGSDADPNKTGVSGEIDAWKGGAAAPQKNAYTNFLSNWNLGKIADENGVPGLVELDAYPVGYWMVQTSSGAYVGISAETFDTGKAKTATGNVNFAAMYPSDDMTSADLANTSWFGYALTSGSADSTVDYADFRFFKIDFDGNGEAKAVVNTDDFGKAMKYTALTTTLTDVNGKHKLAVKTVERNFITNGALSANSDVITGWVEKSEGLWEYVIMIKNSSSRLDSEGKYLAQKGLRLIGAGISTETTAGLVASVFIDAEGDVTGNGTAYSGIGKTAVNLDPLTAKFSMERVGDSEDLRQTGVALMDGADKEAMFMGSFTPDRSLMIGLYLTLSNTGFASAQIGAFVPGVAGAELVDPNDPNIVPDAWNPDGVTQDRVYHQSLGLSTDYLQAISGVSSTFNPAGGSYDYKYTQSNINKSDGAISIIPVEIYGMAVEKVERLVCFLFDEAGNTSKDFSYNSNPSKSVKNGDWWLTDENGVVLQKGDSMAVADSYRLYLAVEDGSKFDQDPTLAQVAGKVALGTKRSTSDSSSGCVYNPATTFSLEWLLLLIAPGVAIIRNRFRK